MILTFTDSDNDPIAIESGAIVAVSLGRLAAPMLLAETERDAERDPHIVTLVHTLAGPLIVRQSVESVAAAWEAAMRPSESAQAHLAVHKLLSKYFHESILRPYYPAAWDTGALAVSKEIEP